MPVVQLTDGAVAGRPDDTHDQEAHNDSRDNAADGDARQQPGDSTDHDRYCKSS